MKKFISVIVACLLLTTSMTSCTQKNNDGSDANTVTYEYKNKKLKDGVIAKIGDEEITVDEARFYLALVSSSLFQQTGLSDATKEEKDKQLDEKYDDENTFRDMIYKQCVDSLINGTILANLGKEKGIDYDSGKLKKTYEENGMTEQKEQLKKAYNVSDEGIDAYTRKQFIYNDYAQQYLMEDSRMNPDDATLKKYFNENYFKAKHILKLTQNQETGAEFSEEEIKNAKSEIDKILADLKKGGDFDKTMETESQDPGSKSQPGGYVFTQGEMVTEFYEGTKALKVGEISDVIKSSFGYHIIKRVELTDSDFEANKEAVKSAYQNIAFENLLKDEKDKFKIYVDYDKLFKITDVFYMSAPVSETQNEQTTAGDK